MRVDPASAKGSAHRHGANSWEIHYLVVPGAGPFIYEPYFDLLIARRGLVFSTSCQKLPYQLPSLTRENPRRRERA